MSYLTLDLNQGISRDKLTLQLAPADEMLQEGQKDGSSYGQRGLVQR